MIHELRIHADANPRNPEQ